MGNFFLTYSPEQMKQIVTAICDKSKSLFVSKSVYITKISELESTIQSLTTRIEALEPHEEEPVNNEDENKPVDDNNG